MANATLRRELKKAIDRVPDDRLTSIADFIAFLSRPTLRERIEKAERDIKAGRVVNWREIRQDV